MGYAIISLDQAKHCGFCVSVGDEIVLYGTCITEKSDYHDASNEIKIFMKELIKEYNPILVTVEDIYAGLGRDTMKKLGILQGILVNYLIEEHILFKIIPPRAWQGKLGYNKKTEVNTKKWSIRIATEIVGCKVKEDTADAICMNTYARDNIKIVESNT